MMADSPLRSPGHFQPSPFPPDFAWGAATASYQIEGATEEGGRGPSIWDDFCRTPGRVWEGNSGATACGHYHRWKEDVALMRDLGLKAYRLSLSWPRIMPLGEGSINDAGLDFYDALVDELLGAGIEPWITLYHWDLPSALYHRGGWMNAAMPGLFADYARVVTDRLSDRVRHWITLNEPQCFIGLGLDSGIHAPGVNLSRAQILRASHHVLLAHGRAVETIREHAKSSPLIGCAPVGVVAIPGSESESDIEAARRAMFARDSRRMIVNPWDDTCVWSNTWWSDPVVFGQYPEDELRAFGADAPVFTPEEMRTIAAPIDFFGVNIYHAITVRSAGQGGVQRIEPMPGIPRSSFQWPVTPDALYWGPRFLHERYKLPVVITENGMANPDWVNLEGNVEDPQRIDFTRRYLRALGSAIKDGVDVRGYFHWSLMDNFEWAEGYKQRFGLIHVDFASLKRTPKSSYYWYQQVIASNGACL